MQRFPEQGYILHKDALQECLSAGHRPLTGAEFALERATHHEKNSPVWKFYPHTDTFVGVGLGPDLKNNSVPTLLIRHGDHVLSTPDDIARLRDQGFQRYKFQLLTNTDKQLWKQYCEEGLKERGPKRKTWVIQDTALVMMVSGVFSLDDAPHNSALVPMLGDVSIVENYSEGHKINIKPRIGVIFDKDAISSEVPLVCPLVFGDIYFDNLVGNGYDYGCVVGVPSGAEGATQKKLEPRKGSPLALILKSN